MLVCMISGHWTHGLPAKLDCSWARGVAGFWTGTQRDMICNHSYYGQELATGP
jgi:hypothetical protein